MLFLRKYDIQVGCNWLIFASRNSVISKIVNALQISQHYIYLSTNFLLVDIFYNKSVPQIGYRRVSVFIGDIGIGEGDILDIVKTVGIVRISYNLWVDIAVFCW